MRRNSTFRCHKRRIGENDIVSIVPLLQTGQRVVFADIGRGEAVKVHIHTGQAHHVRGYVISGKVRGNAFLVVCSERGIALRIHIGFLDVIISADQKPCCATGGIKDRFVLLRCSYFHHHINDMAGCAELSGVALTAHDGKQIFKGITQVFAVFIGKFRNFFQKAVERFRVAVRNIGVTKNITKQLRQIRIICHLVDALGIQIQAILCAVLRKHDLRESIFLKFSGEENTFPTKIRSLQIHIIHKFINEGDGNLLHLSLGIGHLADENVTQGIYFSLNIKIHHGSSLT